MNFILQISSKCGQGGGVKNTKILRWSLMEGPLRDAPIAIFTSVLRRTRVSRISIAAAGRGLQEQANEAP